MTPVTAARDLAAEPDFVAVRDLAVAAEPGAVG